MPRPAKRDELIDLSMSVFNRHGYHASGVDRIMEQTGIAKTTLYRHFRSKEDLIVAALAKVDERFRDEMRAYVERASADPSERLLATFGQLDIWLTDCEFRGCPFISAAGEYRDPNDPVFQQVRLHKRLTLAYFEELVRAAALPDPKVLAQQLMILHEGAIAYAQVLGAEGATDAARRAADRLIDATGSTKPSRSNRRAH